MSVRYILTTHRSREGVRLSSPGRWGNLPFATEEAAIEHARADAKGPIVIDRESFR